jgi:hypothetical protein
MVWLLSLAMSMISKEQASRYSILGIRINCFNFQSHMEVVWFVGQNRGILEVERCRDSASCTIVPTMVISGPAKVVVKRLPIDFFLRSLGSYLQERSIGVILSGMGSDGTLGIRAIKEHAISRCKSLPPIWIRMPSTRRAKGSISLTSLRKFLPSDYSVFLSKKETAIRFARRFARW